MKLVLVAGLVAMVTGSFIPPVPQDNTQYVKTEDERDADGSDSPLHEYQPLDGLLKPRSGADNQYWLYTRNNPNSPQIITLGNAMSIWASSYLGSRPLKVIVHEHGGNGNSEMNRLLTSAWLATTDANVIVVDWRKLASGNYATAANEVANVGRAVGNFVTWLINTAGGNWNNVHFTGLGLGSHIAGNAGRSTGGRPRRITGLDPMNASWLNNPNAISQRDGGYVEIIYTHNTVNNSPQIGNVDFYPNGGRDQPGCSTAACSQSRSYNLFASTIRNNHLLGRQCMSVNEAQNNRCSGSILLPMGNGILTKNAFGIYGLTTGANWPF